ncbi:TauD/TfdA dioxygenase family protein [Piscinibacter sp.]|uniref:TauD/TfdA dioxygenase family protein n=1 Tax=Piscinibacter sp. TaxID=1903157 RepID=UPI002B559940|nr:TauD/TfdA family dioxygenase [Albitalea sp.]HUG21741.1 TauD/TfdA family dioxygenase [Albitalea sp.]
MGTPQIEPLSTTMGADVSGVDLARELDGAEFAAIEAAFHRFKLLRFPAQRISETEQIDFSRRFGKLQVHVLDQFRHPRHPEIYVLSNVDRETGRTIGHHPDMGTLTWHSDLSFQRQPALATILYGIETPAVGGETQFADMAAAYDALDGAMKRRLDGLRAIHDLDVSRRRMGEAPMTEAQRREAPPVNHPLVRTHPDTGRKILYLSRHVSRIDGLPDDDSEALIDELMAHATQPRFVFGYRWRPGDVVMWDNRSTIHRATAYDTSAERRVIHRTVVLGDVPV